MQTYGDMVIGSVSLAGSVPREWKKTRVLAFAKERKQFAGDESEQLLSISEYFGVAPRSEKFTDSGGGSRDGSIVGYRVVRKNDLAMNYMLAWKGSQGVSDYDGVVSPAYAVFELDQSIVAPQFIHYLFRSELFQKYFKSLSRGIMDSRLRLYPETLLHLSVDIPQKAVQQKIADFLDTETAQIDNLIAKQERLLELLEEKRRATITHAVTCGLNPSVELKETNIPWLAQIPAGHSVKKLKAVLRLNTGGAWGGEPVGDESDTVVLRSTEQTVDGAWVLDSPATRKISKSEYDKTKLTIGDLVVTKSSGSELHIGKTSIVDESTAGFSYSNFMQRLRLKQKENPKFYWYLLNSNLAREQYNYYSNSTSGLANLNSTIFDELQFVHFDSSEQSRVVHRLDEEEAKFGELKQKIQTQITLLRERRTSLISHAVTGKIKV